MGLLCNGIAVGMGARSCSATVRRARGRSSWAAKGLQNSVAETLAISFRTVISSCDAVGHSDLHPKGLAFGPHLFGIHRKHLDTSPRVWDGALPSLPSISLGHTICGGSNALNC